MSDVWRCDVTGNPVGTDTAAVGASCQCQGCRAAARIKLLEDALAHLRSIAGPIHTDPSFATIRQDMLTNKFPRYDGVPASGGAVQIDGVWSYDHKVKTS